MFRRLLVPLDGTPEAERGVVVATCLARSVGSDITLVHVFPAAPDAHASKSAFLYLERIARQLPLTGARVGMQVRTGSTADGVLSGVELASADLLVIATSVCEVKQIVFRARIPVVLVPKSTHLATLITRVLMPVSGPIGETLPLHAAAELAHRTGAELVVLRVSAGSQRRLYGCVQEFEDTSAPPSAATGGDFGDAVVEASQQLDPDILVMGISDFVQRFPLESLDAAAVPVLFIPTAPGSVATLSVHAAGRSGCPRMRAQRSGRLA